MISMTKYYDFIKTKKIVFGLLVAILITLSGYIIYFKDTEVLPQSAIYFLNDIPLAQKGQKVLIFSPHPDDETIAAGGYIYDATKNGAEVRIVLVTDGNKHGLKERRYGEFKSATGKLGVPEANLFFLNFSDGKLKEQNQVILKIDFMQEMEQFKPSIVIYPNPEDSHPDHSMTGKIAEEVLQNDKDIQSYQYLVHHVHFPQPKKYRPNDYLLPPLGMVNFDREWLRHMLSKETEDRKKEALDSYKSQLRVPFLKSLMLASIRKNEIYSIDGGGK